MTNSLVTVVVPIYKAEKYLSRCLKSIVDQTYHNLEIILVDDGSPDKCPMICDKWRKKDSRVMVIHDGNKGVSSARNSGIRAATGEYICFVDGDDFLPQDAVECLLTEMEETGADLCCGSVTKISIRETVRNKHTTQTISTDDKINLREILEFDEMKSPWAKLYRVDKIISNSILFPTDIKVSEDTIFTYRYVRVCNSVRLIGNNVYYYNRLNLASATTRYYDKFHEAAYRCTEEYINNIIATRNDISDLDIQKKVISRYNQVNTYLIYFSQDVDDVQKQLEHTYKLFENLICIRTILQNKEQFTVFCEEYGFIESGDFNSLLNYLLKLYQPQKEHDTRNLRSIILKAVAQIKVILIYKLGFYK